jgi:hypothetical protein
MYNFVVEMSMLVSLGLIVYLFARALPRIAHDQPEAAPLGGFDRFVNKLPLEKIDQGLHSFLEKTLRKSRIVFMKLDNYLNGHLKQLKEKQEARIGESLKKRLDEMTITAISESNIPNVKLPRQEKKDEFEGLKK